MNKTTLSNAESADGETSIPNEETYYIMYDCELRKPGCILLQAAGGTVPSGLFWKYFGDSSCWLVALTPNMKLYPITAEQLPILARKTDFTRET